MKYLKNEKTQRYDYEDIISAAAAATASATMLFTGDVVRDVHISLSEEESISINVEEPAFDMQGVSCCVKTAAGGNSRTGCGTSAYAKVVLDPVDGIHIKECTAIEKIIPQDLKCFQLRDPVDSALQGLIVKNMLPVCDKYNYHWGVNVYIFVNETKKEERKAI